MSRSTRSFGTSQRRSLWLKLAVIAAVVAFVLLRPRIEAWINSQKQDANGPAGTNVTNADQSVPVDAGGPSVESSKGETVVPWKRADISLDDADAASRRKAAESDDLLVFDESESGAKSNTVDASDGGKPQRDGNAQRESKDETSAATSAPKPGELTEIRPEVFESTAGLIYRSGSADGHRLDHIMQHAEDDSSKPKHGVFEGERDEILAVIDEAFQKSAAGGSDVRTEDQGERKVVTVNLRRRIGYAGGDEGERKGHPACNYLRLVLENDVEVITAYPTRSF